MTSDTSQRRRKRFRRAESPRRIVPVMRDLETLRLVHQHRFLTSEHLTKLVDGSAQKRRKRLRDLFDNGYLDLPVEQRDRFTAGCRPYVFGLGNRGADLLSEVDGIPRPTGDWTDKNRTYTRMNLEHTLLISDVMVNIRLACRERGNVRLIDQEEILAAAPDETRRRRYPLRMTVEAREGSEVLQIGVVPDRVFALDFLDEPDSPPALFALEADRGTLPIEPMRDKAKKTYRKKLLGYYELWNAWRTGRRAPDFGYRNMRVLTVTTNAGRVGRMIDANRAVTNGHGFRGFLFIDAISLRSADALTVPWRNGRGEAVTLAD